MNTETIISIDQLSHNYGSRQALAQVSFQVKSGTLTVLAGPNGSGKSTLLRLLSGLMRPQQGAVTICGLAPAAQRQALMQRLRCSFAPAALYDGLSAWEHLRFLGQLGGLRSTSHDWRQALRQVGLLGREHEPVRNFSFGMRQRLALACCLVPEPEVLLLDEPTDAMDPRAIQEIRQVVKELVTSRGLTVVLSSHQLQDIEDIADQLLVLHAGTVILHGAPDQLRQAAASLAVEIQGDADQVLQLAHQLGWQIKATDKSGCYRLGMQAGDLQSVAAALAAGGCRLQSYVRHYPTIEELVLQELAQVRA